MSSSFLSRLRAAAPDSVEGRRWRYVPYDQIGAAAADGEPAEVGLVLVESAAKGGRRRYHKQKLALVLANQRHFALEQAERGVAIRYEAGEKSYLDALRTVVDEVGTLESFHPAERELRQELEPLVGEGGLKWVDNPFWLTTEEQFREVFSDGPPWRMDSFYRRVRRDTGLLMEGDGKPAGGKFSFDAENRELWDGEPPAPDPPQFSPDDVTREVGDLVNDRFAEHPGQLDLDAIPATEADVELLWKWARKSCLPHFGPYEDAMSVASRGLFHTRIAPLLNLGRLTPGRVVEEVAELDIPLASREGFVRQILGWREFVRHVHRETEGFRQLPTDLGGDAEEAEGGGAKPSFLGAHESLPDAFWGAESGLHCLDRVVDDVWEEAYSHHITRLMVLANLATLLDIEPREVADWFWVAYQDAYDWVVEPNVLGMGTFAAGGLMTTKPYVSGAAYIARMSDYCSQCRFDPKKNCPITHLYWAFLGRHEEALSNYRRMNLPLASLRNRKDEKKQQDKRVFERVSEALAAGERLDPDGLAE